VPVFARLLRVPRVEVSHARDPLLHPGERPEHVLDSLLPRLHPRVEPVVTRHLLQLVLVPAPRHTARSRGAKRNAYQVTGCRRTHSGFCGLLSSACCHMWSSASTGRMVFGVCAGWCCGGWPFCAFFSWHLRDGFFEPFGRAGQETAALTPFSLWGRSWRYTFGSARLQTRTQHRDSITLTRCADNASPCWVGWASQKPGPQGRTPRRGRRAERL